MSFQKEMDKIISSFEGEEIKDVNSVENDLILNNINHLLQVIYLNTRINQLEKELSKIKSNYYKDKEKMKLKNVV